MRDAALSEKASRILHGLELESLRARYRSLRVEMSGVKSSSGYLCFYLKPIGFASSSTQKQTQQREVQSLGRIPKILARRVELAADGVWPRVVSYSEPGRDELTVFVEFNERGRRVLAGTSPAFSTALGFIRRFLWIGYLTIGLAVVVAILGERIWRSGWQQALVGIFALVAFAVFIRKLWR